MGWRTVLIANKSKLEYGQGYLVCKGEQEFKVHLSEIGYVIIENTAVALTAVLINELNKQNIKVIFCDEKRNPLCELVGYYGNYDSFYHIQNQMMWDKETKQIVWTSIVHNKIFQQMTHLKQQNLPEYKLLEQYLEQLQLNDNSNREGHAAKVYFNALFGNEFKRHQSDDINSALNYGYSILLSAFNREIVANGYLTQFGIFHMNEFNPFNLSSDLMEPYRILIDRVVFENKDKPFDKEFKKMLVNVLNIQVLIGGKKQFVSNAITEYVRSVFSALY